MNNEVDVSLMPYDEWLKFIFDHPVPQDRLHSKNWYWEVDCGEVSDPLQLTQHVTRLCLEFAEVAESYTLPQIDQGIWLLIAARLDFGQYLRDKRVPLKVRMSCVRAMYRVYADFVSKTDVEVMENCFQMWWDLLLDAFYTKGDTGHLDQDAQQIENEMLHTLSQILRLNDPRTQGYALHGLGHLKHPGAKKVVAQYIALHGHKWTDEGKRWLQTCLDGTVM